MPVKKSSVKKSAAKKSLAAKPKKTLVKKVAKKAARPQPAATTAASKKTIAKTAAKKTTAQSAPKKSAAVKSKTAGGANNHSPSKKVAAKKVVKKVAGSKRASTKASPAAKKVAKKVAEKKSAVKPVVKTPTPAPTRFLVTEADAGKRIDRFLGEQMENASRTRIQKWMEGGAVTVNGEPVRKSRTVEIGDSVQVDRPEEVTIGNAQPENIPLEIVYEDKYLVVVNKPKGLVTHPGHGVPGGTLANALLYHYKTMSDFGGSDRPGIVHRLDRDTSGLLVAARDNVTHAALSTMLAERKISRTYHALVWREPSPTGTFDAPLGRHPKDPVKRAVVVPTHRGVPGKPAITHYRVLDWYQFAAHVEITLDTGRTHQIRVHFAHGGHPVAGDTLYGGGEAMLGRVPPLLQTPAAGLLKRLGSQALHAVRLSFTHPRTKKTLSFESPLPQEFKDALKHLAKFKREPEVDDEEFMRED